VEQFPIGCDQLSRGSAVYALSLPAGKLQQSRGIAQSAGNMVLPYQQQPCWFFEIMIIIYSDLHILFTQLHISHEFPLECGEVLPCLDIGYHIYGDLENGQPVVWIFQAMTGNSDPMEWWPGLTGRGKSFDPDKHTIVCANVLGSCYGTTGAISINPATGKPWLSTFPLITIRDMVNAHELLRQHLGIKEIDMAIGGSLGGYQGLEWVIMQPGLIRKLVFIAASARTSPWVKAFSEAQRMALRADPTFLNGDADGGKEGLKAARAMGMISYRSFEAFQKTQFDPEDGAFDHFRAASYLQYQGQKLVNRYNPHVYYTTTKSLDSHDVGRNRGGVREALAGITNTHIHCISIRTDILFPVQEVKEMAAMIPGATHQTIDSLYGHDGFLVENETISQIVNQLMQ
jgi:homoserine O-acetyltransferase/O-succinyltransferase